MQYRPGLLSGFLTGIRLDQELRMRIVGHSDRDANDRYTHTLEEAHRAAAEQTAAYVLGNDPP